MAPLRNKKVVLPLLQTLMGMTPAQRTVIVAHLDEASQDMLIDTIEYVVKTARKKIPQDKADGLSALLTEHKCDVRYMCNRKHPGKLRRRRMRQMGGFPLGLILSTAIPMLFSLLKK